MLSKRTIIGLAVGVVIIGIGAASIVQHLGTSVINEDHTVEVGDRTAYAIPAPAGTQQSMTVTGDRFDVWFGLPGGETERLSQAEAVETAQGRELALEWIHESDGEAIIRIQNTGESDLRVTGTLVTSADPIWITYDLMVMVSGVVIIGFSVGFTMRKPKGF